MKVGDYVLLVTPIGITSKIYENQVGRVKHVFDPRVSSMVKVEGWDLTPGVYPFEVINLGPDGVSELEKIIYNIK
jgi:hypothetical protein